MTAGRVGRREGSFVKWDPEQYARYADERGRPFDDLVRRIPSADWRDRIPGTAKR